MKNLFYILFFMASIAVNAQTEKIESVFVKNVEGIKEYKLQNGLQVLLFKDPSQSNVVVNIVYHVGSRHEGYGETGMAHLLEHMLFKSTKKLGDIKKMLSEKGGSANGSTWYDRTNYFELFPSNNENMRWAIEMESDRMINATMLKSDLEKEFSVVRNEFEIGENSPSRILMERVISTAYIWHNYGNSTIGSKEDIERVDIENLRKFYEKYYQPDNATLIINGNFDEVKALEYVEQYFSVIPKPKRSLEKTYTVEPEQDGERSVTLKRAGDAKILAALYHTPAYADEDFAPVRLLKEILTDNPSGYLYKSLIDTQLASQLWNFTPSLRDPGFSYFSLDLPKANDIEEVEKQFLKELDNIPNLSFTQEDLDRAKRKIANQLESVTNNSLYLSLDLTEAVGAGNFQLWHLNRDRMQAVNLEDITRVAKKYFVPSNRTSGKFIPESASVRVKPKEISDSLILALSNSYKGKEVNEVLESFEPTISNLKKNYATQTLSNGLKLGLINKQLKGNMIKMNIRIPVGNIETLKGKQYIADLMTSMLEMGTTRNTKEQIADKLDKLKTSLSIYWFGQSVFVSIETYEENLEPVLTLLSEILKEPSFPENELIKLKNEQKTFFESQLKDPIQLAFNTADQLREPYPKEHIYYNASFQENIDNQAKVSRNDLVDFHNQFMGMNNAVLSVLGRVESSKLKTLLEKNFGNWNSQNEYQRVFPQHFEVKGDLKIIKVEDKKNAAMQLFTNFEMDENHPDYPALLLADQILGSGGFLTSRIPNRLREKEGISYGAGSFLNIPTDNEHASWGVYAFFNPDFRDKVESATKDEINKALNEGFTEDEFKKSLESWNNSRKTSLGSDDFLLNLSETYLFFQKPIDKFDELNEKVNTLNFKQVHQTLRKYISTNKLVYIFVGSFK